MCSAGTKQPCLSGTWFAWASVALQGQLFFLLKQPEACANHHSVADVRELERRLTASVSRLPCSFCLLSVSTERMHRVDSNRVASLVTALSVVQVEVPERRTRVQVEAPEFSSGCLSSTLLLLSVLPISTDRMHGVDAHRVAILFSLL